MDRKQIEEHWVDMPEFVQEKNTEYKKLIIRFDNEKDYQEFADLIGQKLTDKTKSIWYPKLDRHKNKGKYYGTEVSNLCDLEGKVGTPVHSKRTKKTKRKFQGVRRTERISSLLRSCPKRKSR
jgi:hypothetical protein